MEKGNGAATSGTTTGPKIATGGEGGGGAIAGGSPGGSPGRGPDAGKPGTDPAPAGGQGGGSQADQSGPGQRFNDPLHEDSSGLGPPPGRGPDPGVTGTDPAPVGGRSGGGSQADQRGPGDKPYYGGPDESAYRGLGDSSRYDGDPPPAPGQGSGGAQADQSGPGQRFGDPLHEDSSGLGPPPGSGTPGTDPGPARGQGGSQADQSGPATTEREPWSDPVPPAPGEVERSWRDMPAQDFEYPDGRRLRLDGQGGAEFQMGDRTFKHQGSYWFDTATGEMAPRDIANKASSAIWNAEHGHPPR